MKYITSIIPHEDQPYNTIADWRFSADYKTCYINVSDMGDEVYHNALALHEKFEVMLLLQRMDAQAALMMVDAFDEAFEAARPAGDPFDTEPGDDPKAPYREEHCAATGVERMYIAMSGRSWTEYENKMVEIMKTYAKK